jgi:hypothetical protein
MEKQDVNTIFKKSNPFRVPDNYFELFPEKLMATILDFEKKNIYLSGNISWKKHVRVAAAVIGFIVVSYSILQINRTQIKPLISEQIVHNNDDELSFVDENYIVEALTNDVSASYNDDDIISFLSDNNVEENLITESY